MKIVKFILGEWEIESRREAGFGSITYKHLNCPSYPDYCRHNLTSDEQKKVNFILGLKIYPLPTEKWNGNK